MKNKHDIIWLDTIDSTNEEARRRISEIDNLSVISANCQTSGKGQRGNTWSSNPSENLTFSIVTKFSTEGEVPSVRAADQFVISEIAALAAIDCLATYNIEAKIKWPNDIYVGNKKICGILIENAVRDGRLATSIIGVGLNVNQLHFDPALPNPTSMLICEPNVTGYSREEVLHEYMNNFKRYCARYLNITGGYTRLGRLYLSSLWRFDEKASFIETSTDTVFVGKIKGVSGIGQLVIETEKGELKEFAFKEIGYII